LAQYQAQWQALLVMMTNFTIVRLNIFTTKHLQLLKKKKESESFSGINVNKVARKCAMLVL
jgi:hypothetical protein